MLCPSCATPDSQCRFVFRTQDERPVCFQVDERGAVAPDTTSAATGSLAPFNTTAFWIMDVDRVAIDDHGDIWNLSFVEMRAQLMAPRGFVEPRLGRVQLRAGAAPVTPRCCVRLRMRTNVLLRPRASRAVAVPAAPQRSLIACIQQRSSCGTHDW
jgi:hypothetical protein